MDTHNRQEIKNKHEGNMGTEKGHIHIKTERDLGQRHKENLSGQTWDTE